MRRMSIFQGKILKRALLPFKPLKLHTFTRNKYFYCKNIYIKSYIKSNNDINALTNIQI